MAFYTAEWVRKLVQQDHKALQDHINKKNNDFRSYIDSTLPFTLYLDIDSIRKNILTPNAKFIQGLANALQLDDPQILIDALDKAYQKTINYYIDSYQAIDNKELSDKLNELNMTIDTGGNIKQALSSLFKNTLIISNLSKRNKSVLILSPKFTTIQNKFGSVVKENFDLSQFSDNIDDALQDSPRSIMKKYLDKNFSVLNNLGHVEVDVISSKSNSTEVKRGLVSPRLLQALVDWPKESRADLLTRKFSRETGQAETRIKVRKKFTSSKLVLEMLIEAGMMIGSVESQEENLRKAPKERAFLVGRNLTARIKQDPSFLKDLETSKSLKNFVANAIVSAIRGEKVQPYTSDTNILVSSKITREKVVVAAGKKAVENVSTPKLQKERKQEPEQVPLASLLVLLKEHLQHVVSANMGDGSRKDILNYRTGRFASSVDVEKLTKSREGMITAFYTYMKNPYATFSAGGRQSTPKTRDPKLLISKSIREIAATVVKNRMRAVLV